MHEDQFLHDVLQGRQDAVLFCRMLGDISQVWDDLVDGDKAVPPERVNEAFVTTLLRLPKLPFWRDHIDELMPVMRSAVFDWLAANALEGGNAHDRSVAFVLRDSLVAVVVYCAYIIGGHQHAAAVAPMVRRYYHDESLTQYTGALP